MKLKFNGFLIIICIFLLVSCSPEKQANYYRWIRLDGQYSIIGIFPVPDGIAKQTDCYHFVYDDQGRIVKVEYLNRGKIAKDYFLGIEKILIKYSKGVEKRIFLNGEDQPLENEDGIYSLHLTLDAENHRIALINFNKEAETTEDKYGVAQYLWTLDEQGRRIKEFRLNKVGEKIIDSNRIFEIRLEYDKKGNIIKVALHTNVCSNFGHGRSAKP